MFIQTITKIRNLYCDKKSAPETRKNIILAGEAQITSDPDIQTITDVKKSSNQLRIYT
jgi:hypothetical protein